MNKLSNPLGNGKEVWITNTYHGAVAGNPSNFDNHVAIDISGVNGTPVYACADGVCSATIGTGSARYFKLDINDCSFRALYVHSSSKFTKPTAVKKGQVIGQIIPYIYYVNGVKTQADHLHFGLQNKDMKIPHPMPMEYLDRVIVFKTRYPSIEKLWFKDGKINWAIFRNLSYLMDPDMEYFKLGMRIKLINRATRYYSGTGVDRGRVAVGAVATVMSNKSGQLPNSFTADYYYNIRFADKSLGYVAHSANWQATTDYETNPNATKPDTCTEYKDKVTALSEEVEELRLQINILDSEIDAVNLDNEKLQMALTKYGDDKKAWEDEKVKLETKITDLQTQLALKKADVVANLSVIETLHLALQKVWDKFFPEKS